jgi:signal transduction histidine kinase
MVTPPVADSQIPYLLDRIAELERANKNYLRIMRIMAHDLRNPLGGITSLAETLLADEELSAESLVMLNLIKTAGIHSMEMISELLKTGLSDNDEVMEKQLTDIHALLFDSVELLSYKAKEKNQRIIFQTRAAPLTVMLNYEKIWRVFNNLIVNAIKFSHQDKAIVVALADCGDHVLISVADKGVGIPEQDKESIFEMFTTAKKTGTNGEPAFGLGLSISKRILEKHGGKIWFESKVNLGTTFYISLPK